MTKTYIDDEGTLYTAAQRQQIGDAVEEKWLVHVAEGSDGFAVLSWIREDDEADREYWGYEDPYNLYLNLTIWGH